MGWLWSSSQTDSKNAQPSQPSTQQPPAPAPIQEQSHPVPTQPPQKELSRDERAAIEFQDLMRELNAPPASINPRPADSPAPRDAAHPSQYTQKFADPSIHPINLYPRDMSCRAAFDLAFYCQSMGGQFINNYRYGGMRDCSQNWSNFWFCMRTNRMGYDEQTRVDRLRKHYWDQDSKYRKGPSSEDVWQMRDKIVEEPFSADYSAIEESELMKEHTAAMKRRMRNFIKGNPTEHLDDPEDE